MNAQIRELIYMALPRVGANIEKLMVEKSLDSIRLRTQRVDESECPIGRSKLGGSPDLPLHTEWPSWKGEPLSFIAQLWLPDITEYDNNGILPRSGMLSFFYSAEQDAWGFDPEDRDGSRVLYFNADPATFTRTTPPSSLVDYGRFLACGFDFYKETSIPELSSATLDELELTEDEVENYWNLLEKIERLPDGVEGPIHRVLGNPNAIQGDMQLECQLVSHGLYCGDPTGYSDPRALALEEGAVDWLLLLQVDSDDNAEMMWGDVGRLYFWIPQKELRVLNFDSAWTILQCS